MDLYYSPLACSIAARIVCHEAQLPVTLHRVDLATQRTDDGADFAQINPLAQVPTLILDDGRTFTEVSAVLLWLAAQAPTSGLAPPAGSSELFPLVRWLSFVATELHKNINYRLFSPSSPDVIRAHARATADKPLAVLERHLAHGGAAVAGDTFTVADAYLIWALTIMPAGGVAFDPYPAIRDYRARHHKRASVAAVFTAERAEYNQLAARPVTP
jgi:glutathione S-transferase